MYLIFYSADHAHILEFVTFLNLKILFLSFFVVHTTVKREVETLMTFALPDTDSASNPNVDWQDCWSPASTPFVKIQWPSRQTL